MTLLSTRDLSKRFQQPGRLLAKGAEVNAVNGVNLKLEAGKTLAIVGETGSGKSTLARLLIGIEKPTSGEVYLSQIKLNYHDKKQRKQRFRDIRMIYRDPALSLNPQARIGQTLDSALKMNTSLESKERRLKINQTLVRVGMQAADKYRYPNMFSNGERQRIAIARAIILDPKIVIADEPLSTLDVSIQAQILNLMQDLQEDLGISYLFISHDLNVVEHIADNVLVLMKGSVVEQGLVSDIFDNPQHAYTRSLFASAPMYNKRFVSAK